MNGFSGQAEKLVRQANALDDDMVALRRATAKPYPYRFEIKRAATSTGIGFCVDEGGRMFA